MLARRNVVLLALAAGLIAVDLGTRPRAAEARDVAPLFPTLDGAEAQRIVITDPKGPGAEALELVKATGAELERAPGAPWRVVSKAGWPAQTPRVAFLLRVLQNLNNSDLLASDAVSHGDYGLLEDDAARLQLYSSSGELLADLLQGDAAPGGRATYVRVFGENEVWRAASLRGRLPSSPEVWMRPGWLPFERAEVVVSAVELSGSALPEGLRLERSPGSMQLWLKPDEELASSEAVRSLLTSLSALTVSEVQGEDDGADVLEAPYLRIRLERGSEDEAWTGLFAEPQKAGEGVRALRSAGDWTVVFPDSALQPILRAIERL